MKKILKLTFILFVICAITAGILGVVNYVTKDRIAAYLKEKTDNAYRTVLNSESFNPVEFDKSNPVFANIDAISEASNGEGWVVESTFSGAQGKITMATGVSKDFKCTGISIISHSETSGLGANAASTAEVGVNFRNQFIGQGADVALKKMGGEIDALTGATITSKSVTGAVARAIEACMALG